MTNLYVGERVQVLRRDIYELIRLGETRREGRSVYCVYERENDILQSIMSCEAVCLGQFDDLHSANEYAKTLDARG